MKRDIEWLISEIDQRVEAHKETTPYNTGVATGMRSSLFLINQLDEPEVLSQEWVSDNAVAGQYPDGMGYVVPAYKLQNLLVPKQEEITHKQVEKYLLDKNIRVIDIDIYEEMQSELEELKNGAILSKTETVADVIAGFFKSLERLKEVMSMEVEELEE